MAIVKFHPIHLSALTNSRAPLKMKMPQQTPKLYIPSPLLTLSYGLSLCIPTCPLNITTFIAGNENIFREGEPYTPNFKPKKFLKTRRAF